MSRRRNAGSLNHIIATQILIQIHLISMPDDGFAGIEMLVDKNVERLKPDMQLRHEGCYCFGIISKYNVNVEERHGDTYSLRKVRSCIKLPAQSGKLLHESTEHFPSFKKNLKRRKVIMQS